MGQRNNVLNVYMNRPERVQSVLEYYTGKKLPKDWAVNCEEIQEQNKQHNIKYKKGDDYLYQYKEDNYLEPVVNLMLYWGKRKWKKPISIKEMVNLSSIPLDIEGMLMDYGVHMIDMRSISDEALDEMDSDLKYVLGIMKCGNSKEKYIEYVKKYEEFFRRIPKSAVDVINVFTNMGKINNVLIFTQTEDGEECADMCKAVNDLVKDSMEIGENRMAQLNKLLIGANRIADLMKASEDTKYRKKLYQEFGLVN